MKAPPHSTADDLVVFTDGSCLGNGSRSARAGYAMVWPEYPALTSCSPLPGETQTNNRAEYHGAINAIQTADKIDPGAKRTLVIYTDSNLLIRTCTQWLSGWKKKGWKTAAKTPVANLDLVLELDRLLEKRHVRFVHVAAHTGKTDWASRYNEEADRLARSAALRKL